MGNRTGQENKRGDSKVESNDSPEIPDRGETSDIPGLPSGGAQSATEDYVRADSWSSIGPASRRRMFDSLVRQGSFLPESTFNADSLTVSVYPHIQSHAFTSVSTLRIP